MEGRIVWVRRRNGSWWPGRILGEEDLSACHLMSPRSGTPVKLLGREDASVDWYNLEKSKRVKAFRCGEFDDCIQRAEASQGLPAKKREKYARREDAILHALKLEKQYGNLVKPMGFTDKSSDSPTKLSPTPNGQPGRKLDKSNLMAKDAIHPSLEHHSITMGSQTRGLQDVRLINRMLYSTASEDSNPTAIDGHSFAASGNASDSDSRNSIGKGKRLLEGYAEEPIPKRQRLLRPFVNVRHNSAESPNHSLRPDMYAHETHSSEFTTKQGSQGHTKLPFSLSDVATHPTQHLTFAQESEETISGSSEQTKSDSSETHSIEPRLEAGMLLSDVETCMRVQPRLRDELEMQVGAESISNVESDELSLVDKSQFHHLEQKVSGAEVSKWQLKGKRNVRNTGKRPIDRFTQKTYFDTRGRPLNKMETSHSLSYYHDNGFTNDGVYSEDDFDLHAHGFGQRGCLQSQVAARRHSYIGSNRINWELAWGRPFRGYWEERGESFSPMFNGHDILIDAELKVQANRQGEHVPWVSLMSKLNGKAIIGHPIQIESLEDGSTDTLLSTSDELGFESGRGKVPSIWRTARRTANVRAPHPHQSSQLYVDEDTDYRHLHQSGKVSKKSAAPNSVRKGSKLKKTDSLVYRSPQGMNKTPRKGNLTSNQKTKSLSSIGFDRKVTDKTSGDEIGHYMDGVIKHVESRPPTVACIRVKLAFSRLLKAVGRPPSGPASHGVSVGSNKDRKPSQVELCKF